MLWTICKINRASDMTRKTNKKKEIAALPEIINKMNKINKRRNTINEWKVIKYFEENKIRSLKKIIVVKIIF